MTTLRCIIAASLLVLTAAACSGGGSAASVTPPPGVGASVTAHDGAFDGAPVKVTAGQPLKLFFRNLDPAPHNIAIYADSSAAKSVFVGDRITNAATVYDVPALAPGSYFFRCDVHPNMTGSLVADG